MLNINKKISSLACAVMMVLMFDSQSAVAQEGAKESIDFNAHMDRCTEKYGYDPAQSSHLGSAKLGKNELKWRECLYEGIREIIMPTSLVADEYERYIERDRSLTGKIEKGLVTRNQRDTLLFHLNQEIQVHEQAAEFRELEKTRDAFRARQQEMERARRLQIKRKF